MGNRAVVLDTCVVADIERGTFDMRKLLGYTPGISVITLGELMTGVAKAKDRVQRKRRADNLAALISRLFVLGFTTRTAVAYSMLNASARGKGKEGQRSDMLIAASAMEHGASLLTNDRGLARLQEVSRLNVLRPEDL
jgi:predicted nucleic acid-binding protein